MRPSLNPHLLHSHSVAFEISPARVICWTNLERNLYLLFLFHFWGVPWKISLGVGRGLILKVVRGPGLWRESADWGSAFSGYPSVSDGCLAVSGHRFLKYRSYFILFLYMSSEREKSENSVFENIRFVVEESASSLHCFVSIRD